MSKLQHEIALNNTQLKDVDDKKEQRRELVDNLLDAVSGGGGWGNISWTNFIN